MRMPMHCFYKLANANTNSKFRFNAHDKALLSQLMRHKTDMYGIQHRCDLFNGSRSKE